MQKGIPLILLWIWQFPQHLLAMILVLILKPESSEYYNGCKIYRVKQSYLGLSLGRYIFLSTNYQLPTIMHEYGHSIQSLWLGPLYLMVIGFPSLMFCYLRDRLFHNEWDMTSRIQWYYEQPTERSADKLGGVDRVKYPFE